MKVSLLFFGVNVPKSELTECLDQYGVDWQWARKKGRLDIFSYWRTARILLSNNPNLIVIHGLRNVPIAWCLKKMDPKQKICMVHHGPVNEIMSPVGGVLTRWSLRETQLNISVSDSVTHRIQQMGGKTNGDERRILTIPNGVDVNFYSDVSAQVLAKTKTKVKLCMTAVFTPQKDHDTLLRACAMLSERNILFELHFFGDGPLLNRGKRQADSLGISNNTFFHGIADSKNIRSHLATTDIYVHCTHSEGMSIALLEAMASGLPVIISDIEGARNLTKSGAKLNITRIGSAEDVVESIVSLINNPQKAREEGSKNRIAIENNFSLYQTADKYFNQWQQLIQNNYQ